MLAVRTRCIVELRTWWITNRSRKGVNAIECDAKFLLNRPRPHQRSGRKLWWRDPLKLPRKLPQKKHSKTDGTVETCWNSVLDPALALACRSIAQSSSCYDTHVVVEQRSGRPRLGWPPRFRAKENVSPTPWYLCVFFVLCWSSALCPYVHLHRPVNQLAQKQTIGPHEFCKTRMTNVLFGHWWGRGHTQYTGIHSFLEVAGGSFANTHNAILIGV